MSDASPYGDDEPATWCRIFNVGPACPVPCGDCKGTNTTLGDMRRQIEQEQHE